jgi:ornithine--oxo-acid transaminase
MNLIKLFRRPARPVNLIGVASGLGAGDARCGEGPARLRADGLLARLSGRGLDAVWRAMLRPARGARRSRAIDGLCARLAREVAAAVRAGGFPVVIGGDHSCAVGTWTGAAKALSPRGPLGLVWLDAHMDSHTPKTSPSGRLHGMTLAALLGQKTLSPRHVCLVGVRSFESEEAALLERFGVRVFTMREIEERGAAAVLDEAIRIAAGGTAGYGISVDLDALDPGDAPGVGTPVAGGIPAAGLIETLKEHAGDPALVALEIAEYNPHLDEGGRTARVIDDLIAAVCVGERAGARSMIELEQAYAAGNYKPLPLVLTRGSGVHVWDDHGRRYLDMMSAYSAVSHGHCHPRLVAALSRQAQLLAVTSRAYHNDRLPPFLERLCELTGQDRAIPVNTGLEAVETALKAARKWAHKVKGVPHDSAEIIACEGNFHGRSIAIVAMSSEAQYRDGFGPYPPGMKRVPYGDAPALERAITPRTAAFLVEPIQGEQGIVVPPAGYLAQCARICRERNVLLIADEVQTGLGRTGKLLACGHEGVKPDGLILGKALGGGLLPVSAFLARSDVMAVFEPGDHGSTFGGNPLGAAVALEALNVLVEERLVERSAEMGALLLDGLEAIGSPLVREVRGRGLFAGIEIEPAWASAYDVVERLLAHGILSKDTHKTVVRFAPPLVITRAQLGWALKRIRRVLAEIEDGVKKAA